ncbi:Parkin co-regulated protein [Phytophthora cactorum]|nr:Parkin co-regulated protein [Phytophthora cactorum]
MATSASSSMSALASELRMLQPMRVNFAGAVRKLQWQVDLSLLDFSHYLPVFMEGLRELEEPYHFLALNGTLDMLEKGGSRVLPCLPQLIPPMKANLMTRNQTVLCLQMKVLQRLVLSCPYTGEALVPYYRQLLSIFNLFITKRVNCGDSIDYAQRRQENLGDLILDTLNILEKHGGADAFVNIKYMIPTWSPDQQLRCHFCNDKPGHKEDTDEVDEHMVESRKLVALDKLETVSMIGRGSSGQVFKARHCESNVLYAVKVVTNVFDKPRRDQLLTEIRTLYGIESEHLVGFYGAYFQDHALIAAIAMQILTGLAHLKRVRHVHRDIKPQNILVQQDGAVKLTDFGLARELSSSTSMAQTFVGTFKYMAPERLHNATSMSVRFVGVLRGFSSFISLTRMHRAKESRHEDHGAKELKAKQHDEEEEIEEAIEVARTETEAQASSG